MKTKKYLSGSYAFKSDIGRVRLNNEDRVCALTSLKGDVLLIVCDGMGGSKKGDLASSLAVDFICDAFRERKNSFIFRTAAMYWLASTIRKANKLIYDEGQTHEEYANMGTTLTAVLIVKNFMVIAQIGDSRAYTIKDGKLYQLTEDQSYVAYLYRTGQITASEMETHPKRHMLMNALGIYPSVEIDMRIMNYNNNPLLLCSDGLYNNVPLLDIESVMKSSDTVNQKVDELIVIANNNGGSDNIGVVIWESDENAA